MELTRQAMLDYLKSPQKFDCTLKIQYATTVSKSYGSEKRFFVPAPIIRLTGDGWLHKQRQVHQFYKEQAALKKIDAFQVPIPQIDGVIGVHDVKDHPELEFAFIDYEHTYIAKTLYIRHTEAKNYIKMALEFKYNSGCKLGTFLSDQIKVISKASKAKNFTKNPDFKYLAVSSGQYVCLSNRPKVPPITSFITAEEDKFSVSTTQWSPLKIYLVDMSKSPLDELQFCSKNGPIHYGDVVRLVYEPTGTSLPRLRICKVNKDKVVVLDDGVVGDEDDLEILNQMQKVVLQMVDEEEFTYVHLQDNGIVLKTEKDVAVGEVLTVPETAIFTLCCTDDIKYTFYDAMGPTFQNVFPAPVCTGINLDSYDTNFPWPQNDVSNFLMGKNYTDDLSVWLGTFKCATMLWSTETIEFTLPPVQKLKADAELIQRCNVSEGKIEVPILLVRNDGVVFPTGLTFNYRNVQSTKNEII